MANTLYLMVLGVSKFYSYNNHGDTSVENSVLLKFNSLIFKNKCHFGGLRMGLLGVQ